MEGEGNDHTKKPSRSAGKPTQGFRIKIAELHHLRSSKQISARGQGRESGHARTPSWSPGKPTPKVGEPSEQTDRSHLCRVLAEAWVFSRCCRRFTKRGDGFLFAAEWKEKKKRRNARKKNKNRCGSGDEGRHIKNIVRYITHVVERNVHRPEKERQPGGKMLTQWTVRSDRSLNDLDLSARPRDCRVASVRHGRLCDMLAGWDLHNTAIAQAHNREYSIHYPLQYCT